MILVTGGAGYIGSHTCLELLEANYSVLAVDNFSNSSAESLARVQKITSKQLTRIEGDVRDQQLMDDIFSQYTSDAVVHFAGLKAVGESVSAPLAYYDNNINSSNDTTTHNKNNEETCRVTRNSMENL